MASYGEIQTQKRRDEEWRAAWDGLPPEQRAELEAAIAGSTVFPVEVSRGKVVHETATADAAEDGREVVGREGDAVELCDQHAEFCAVIDLAAQVDTMADQLRERFGPLDGQAEAVAEFIAEQVKRAEMQSHALLLARLAGFLVGGEGNPLARIHALLHAIPALARLNGVRSLRHSAELCTAAGPAFKCSTEWISRLRERWCQILEVPVPAESTKSDAAKAKYSEINKHDHWRHKKCTSETIKQK